MTIVVLEESIFQSEPDPAEQTEPLDPPQRLVQIQANQLVARDKHGQAAFAFAKDKQEPAALHLFLKEKMIERSPEFYASITRTLNHKGITNAAAALNSEFNARMAGLPVAAPSAGQKHALLPTHCPQCGAPIHAGQAKWVDASTAECEYCGSLIRPE
jgi:hypothetical protein